VKPARIVYLDNQATTPTDPRVVEAMMPYFTRKFGNPHSRDHAYGWEADEAVEKARTQVAHIIGADPKEIVFTSGATESNNLAILGLARFFKGRKGHIVTLATEHKCVLESCRAAEAEGYRVTFLPVDDRGRISPAAIEMAIGDDTLLVSVMAAHNEIGVIQPLAEIGALCRSRKVYFHTDAAQAVGKIPLDVEAMKIDLMSISSHKVYGPMGIGALYIRRRPRVRLAPLLHGGGQERGLRSGTLPAPLCVGMGEACAIAEKEMGAEAPRLKTMRDRLAKTIQGGLDGVHINGDRTDRLPANLNISFDGVDSARLMGALTDLALSSGSACTSASVEPSYVLKALGLDDDRAAASVRIGLGRFTTDEEVDYAAKRFVEVVKRLRSEPATYQVAATAAS
jgi:cysteine desulfurase